MSTNAHSKTLKFKYLVAKNTVLDHGPYGKSRLRSIQQLLEWYYCHWTITIDTTVLHESPSFCQNQGNYQYKFIYCIFNVFSLDYWINISSTVHCQFYLPNGQQIKGQLISEHIYAVLNFPKMQRNIARISSLASKMGQIKKVEAQYHPNYL